MTDVGTQALEELAGLQHRPNWAELAQSMASGAVMGAESEPGEKTSTGTELQATAASLVVGGVMSPQGFTPESFIANMTGTYLGIEAVNLLQGPIASLAADHDAYAQAHASPGSSHASNGMNAQQSYPPRAVSGGQADQASRDTEMDQLLKAKQAQANQLYAAASGRDVGNFWQAPADYGFHFPSGPEDAVTPLASWQTTLGQDLMGSFDPASILRDQSFSTVPVFSQNQNTLFHNPVGRLPQLVAATGFVGAGADLLDHTDVTLDLSIGYGPAGKLSATMDTRGITFFAGLGKGCGVDLSLTTDYNFSSDQGDSGFVAYTYASRQIYEAFGVQSGVIIRPGVGINEFVGAGLNVGSFVGTIGGYEKRYTW